MPSYHASRKQAANRSAIRRQYRAQLTETEHVFHLCAAVSPLKDKAVNSGSVTEAQNAIRITKQIEMDQKQCGFTATP